MLSLRRKPIFNYKNFYLMKPNQLFKRTILFCFTILFSYSVKAQLYSSGNNSISGNNVGIGVVPPTANLHIWQTVNKTTEEVLNQDVFLIERGSYKSRIIGYREDGSPIFADFSTPGTFVPAKPLFLVNKLGFVGIDIAVPTYKFHLNGTGFVSRSFFVMDKMGIGTATPQEKLHVEGNILINNGDLIINGQNSSVNNNNPNKQIRLQSDGYIRAREIKVDLQTIPDYVFKPGYNLMPLADLKIFIETNKHLPNVKSEAEFNAVGSISLTEMNMKLLEKVEELTLYVLDLQAQIDELKIK